MFEVTMRRIDAQSIEMRNKIRVACVTTYLREPSEAEIEERLAILIRQEKVSHA